MKKIISFLGILISVFLFSIPQGFSSAIDFSIDPIKYEVEVDPGDSITLEAAIRNNSDSPVTLPTAVSDFQASWSSGTPSFVRRSELVFPDQELSSWITLSVPSITLAPGERWSIDFTIDVPSDAIPGWHYGAVIFKNPGSALSSTWNVGINVDYGILLLINVSGDIIIDGEVWPISLGGGSSSIASNNNSNNANNSSSWTWEKVEVEEEVGTNNILGITSPKSTFDNCPLGDFTNSNFDGKCFDNPFSPEEEIVITPWEDEEAVIGLVPLGEQEDFGIDFQIPFKNTGTTHVKPTGKIILEDSEGNQFKNIGREVIVSDLGVIIGENIVDYIPINDTEWNVLPNTNRIFEGQWEGFPYKTYDDEWNEVIKHWNPSEYYTRQNKEEAGFLMFWERVSEARRHEKVTAIINIAYTDENGEVVEFNSAEDFYIDYTEQYISMNPYVILPLLIFWLLLGLYFIMKFWFLIWKKKKKCKSCNTRVRDSWHVCPKCKKKIK